MSGQTAPVGPPQYASSRRGNNSHAYFNAGGEGPPPPPHTYITEARTPKRPGSRPPGPSVIPCQGLLVLIDLGELRVHHVFVLRTTARTRLICGGGLLGCLLQGGQRLGQTLGARLDDGSLFPLDGGLQVGDRGLHLAYGRTG